VASAALTFGELLVVMAVLVVVGILVAPKVLRPVRAKVRKADCASALRSVGVAFRSFSDEHDKKFPAALVGEDGWSTNWETDFIVSWRSVSNELATPHVLLCPDDARFAAIDFVSLTRSNLSYFLSLDASPMTPQAVLVGDRNLSSNGVPVEPGIFSVGPKSVLGVTARLHGGSANLLFGDGSVTAFGSVPGASPAFTTATNRLAVP